MSYLFVHLFISSITVLVSIVVIIVTIRFVRIVFVYFLFVCFFEILFIRFLVASFVFPEDLDPTRFLLGHYRFVGYNISVSLHVISVAEGF